MDCVIYVREHPTVSIYQQFNGAATYAARHGYSIKAKVLDFQGNKFHEAVNKLIADHDINALIIYSKETAFDNSDDYLFFKIYCEKLGKKLISCN